MQEWVRATGAKICIVFEGRDTACKGCTIKRIVEEQENLSLRQELVEDVSRLRLAEDSTDAVQYHLLSRALEKLGAYAGRLPMHARPETAHMFIVNPLSGRSFQSLFSTHPPIEERVSRLRGVPASPSSPPPPPSQGGSSPTDSGKAFWDRMSGR